MVFTWAEGGGGSFQIPYTLSNGNSLQVGEQRNLWKVLVTSANVDWGDDDVQNNVCTLAF